MNRRVGRWTITYHLIKDMVIPLNHACNTLKDIKHLLTQLEQSKILRRKLLRFEIILKDIRENRIRIDNAIRSTVHLFEDSYNDEKLKRHINHLVKDKSINDDQREALLKKS